MCTIHTSDVLCLKTAWAVLNTVSYAGCFMC